MYIVTKRLGRNETRLREFTLQDEAEFFIQEKLREDRQFKIVATYCLYEWSDLIKEYSEKDIEEESGASSGQGAGARSGFSPTPFNTAPRPTGMPHNWVKHEDDKKDDKESEK